MGTPKPLPPRLQAWADPRKRHRLSHAHVQMARELGMNPNKLGKLDNHRQEPWKAPLPEFIEHLYLKRFGRERPEVSSQSSSEHHSQQRTRQPRTSARPSLTTART